VELRALRTRERRLEQARAHYADLFDFAPVTYLLLDSVGIVITINLAGCRLLDAERRRVVGHPMLAFVALEDRGELLDHLRRCRAGDGGAVESELRLMARGGHRVTCRLHSRRTRVGARVVFPTVIIDQTAHIALDDARLSAERRMEEAERDAADARTVSAGKDRFLAVVSHELRTPLTPALFAASRLLSWQDLPEQARKLAGTIKRNIEFEARLIDDLLDVARINRNKVNLKLETLDVHDVAREAITVCRSASEAKSVLIAAHLAADVHHVTADRTRLRQVFWNLLNNAIKFTDAGGRITVVSSNAHGDLVRVSVRDTGTGMDTTVLDGLFIPFDRRPVSEGSRAGLGLGLAICKGIISAHGGQIWASSEGPGRGSNFAVELRTVAPPAEATVEVSSPPKAPVDGRVSPVKRVLVVEDDVDSSEMLGQFLSQRGYLVEVVASVAAALPRLVEHWDILLSDIGLPDGSGLDLARRAREMPHPPHRLIALTGFGSNEDIRASRAAGFDAHVVKPIDIQSLLDSLEVGGLTLEPVTPYRESAGSAPGARASNPDNRGTNPATRDSGFRTRASDSDA
jgi:PAS domain S-box-containing protein